MASSPVSSARSGPHLPSTTGTTGIVPAQPNPLRPASAPPPPSGPIAATPMRVEVDAGEFPISLPLPWGGRARDDAKSTVGSIERAPVENSDEKRRLDGLLTGLARRMLPGDAAKLLAPNVGIRTTLQPFARAYEAAPDAASRALIEDKALRHAVINTPRALDGKMLGRTVLKHLTAYARELGFKNVQLDTNGHPVVHRFDADPIPLSKVKLSSVRNLDETVRNLGRELNSLRFQNPRYVPPHPANETPGTGFDVFDAHRMSHLAMLNGTPTRMMKAQLSKWGFRPESLREIIDEETDTDAFAVADAQGNLYLSFNGTTNMDDLRNDVRFALKEVEWAGAPGARVHTGFNRCIESIWPRVLETMESMQKKYGKQGGTVFVGGHSLGGALAQLTALRLQHDLKVPPSQMEVYTFGAPRVGNSAFVETYQEHVPRTHRVVTDNGWGYRDPIAIAPARILGYRDVGQRVLISPSGGLTISSPTGEPVPTDDGAVSEPQGWDWLPSPFQPALENHRAKHYLARFGDAADATAGRQLIA